MNIIRFFIKPAGVMWCDLPCASSENMAAVAAALTREGFIVCPDFWLPKDSILLACMMTLPDEAPRKPAAVLPFNFGRSDEPKKEPPQ